MLYFYILQRTTCLEIIGPWVFFLLCMQLWASAQWVQVVWALTFDLSSFATLFAPFKMFFTILILGWNHLVFILYIILPLYFKSLVCSSPVSNRLLHDSCGTSKMGRNWIKNWRFPQNDFIGVNYTLGRWTFYGTLHVLTQFPLA